MDSDNYYKNIRKAIEKITIAEKDIKDGKTVEVNLEKLLPPVITEKRDVTNYWITREANLFKSTEKKEEKLFLLKRVKSRLYALMYLPSEESPVNKDDIKNRIKSILLQKQFQYFDFYSLKERFLKWFLSISFIKELLEIMNLDVSNVRHRAILYIILAVSSVTVSFITGFLIISLKRRFAGTVLEGYRDRFYSKKTDAMLWEKKAFELSENGNYRLALQGLLYSLLLSLDRRDIILFDGTKTNREYMRLIKNDNMKKISEVFEIFCNIYDRKWYGLEDCSEKEYTEAFEIFKDCLRKI
jgi:hypothetical protein